MNNDKKECVALNRDKFQAVTEAFVNGDSSYIQRLLKVSHISNGRIYSDSGSSKNLLHICTITHQVEIFKLLVKDYSIKPYSVFMDAANTVPYFHYIFSTTSESFIIPILEIVT